MSLKFTPLFLLGSYAFAGTPDTYVRSDSPAFDTLNQAAQAALQNAVYDSRMQGFEYGGAIIQVDNKFYYTYPVTIGDPLKVEFTIKFHHTDKLVGLYHTHPENRSSLDVCDTTRFSNEDIVMARQLKVPSYIWVEKTNSYRVFLPGQSITSLIRNEHDVLEYTSIGQAI
jgi:hypothetical protein